MGLGRSWRSKYSRYSDRRRELSLNNDYVSSIRTVLTLHFLGEVDDLLLVLNDLHTLRVGVVPHSKFTGDGRRERSEISKRLCVVILQVKTHAYMQISIG